MPFNISDKFYYLNLPTFIGLRYVSFSLYHKSRDSTGFLGYLFPKSICLHRSARVDDSIFLANLMISPILLLGAGLQAWVSTNIAAVLIELNNNAAIFVGTWTAPVYLCILWWPVIRGVTWHQYDLHCVQFFRRESTALSPVAVMGQTFKLYIY